MAEQLYTLTRDDLLQSLRNRRGQDIVGAPNKAFTCWGAIVLGEKYPEIAGRVLVYAGNQQFVVVDGVANSCEYHHIEGAFDTDDEAALLLSRFDQFYLTNQSYHSVTATTLRTTLFLDGLTTADEVGLEVAHVS